MSCCTKPSAIFFWKLFGHFKQKKANLLDPKDIQKKKFWSWGNFLAIQSHIYLNNKVRNVCFSAFLPRFLAKKGPNGPRSCRNFKFFFLVVFWIQKISFLVLKVPTGFSKKNGRRFCTCRSKMTILVRISLPKVSEGLHNGNFHHQFSFSNIFMTITFLIMILMWK